MNLKLCIDTSQEARDLIDATAFSTYASGNYRLDHPIMEHLNCLAEEEEGWRPVAVHVMPFTVVDGKNVYYAFNSVQDPTLYVSFPIYQDDFVAPEGEQMMSFCRTIIGKIVRTFDAPHIDLKLDMTKFLFPTTVKGEFVWAMEIRGENHQVVDELVGQLGSVLGRVALDDILSGTVQVNSLSFDAVTYKDPKQPLLPNNLTL
ncbi:hypothetical protein D3C76_112740 [compost metagenome]